MRRKRKEEERKGGRTPGNERWGRDKGRVTRRKQKREKEKGAPGQRSSTGSTSALIGTPSCSIAASYPGASKYRLAD